MPFLSEPPPPRGQPLPVAPGVRRIVARNAGPMTYHGTNTYLIDMDAEGVAVLDPGPDDAPHVQAILQAAGGRRIRHILLTHRHHDHAGAVGALRQATAASLAAFPASGGMPPDLPLRDGDTVAGLQAFHTPGHAADHLCFLRGDLAFTGDHVMTWSSSAIGPPDGHMGDYMRSLERLLGRTERLCLPGHGPPHADLSALCESLLEHRRAREAEIAAALTAEPLGLAAITGHVYGALPPPTRFAAECTVAAHLEKLVAEGRALQSPGGWRG